MAKGIYKGVNDIARRVVKIFTGVLNLARQAIKGYVGDTNGIAQLFYSADEEVTITSSRTWVVPDGASTIDIFVVGGGGGAGGSTRQVTGHYDYNSQITDDTVYGASGGGGYTATSFGISVTGGESLNIVVGAGGIGGKSFVNNNGTNTGDVTSVSATTHGTSGGETYVARGNTKLISANGGGGGYRSGWADSNINRGTNGTNGGNASGAAGGYADILRIDSQGHGTETKEFEGYANDTGPEAENTLYGYDGTEGSNGGNTDVWWLAADHSYTKLTSNKHTGGTGQGRNTRRFGQAGATVYSTVATTVSPNTGNSGSLGLTAYTDKNGSSGIVIIAIHY